MKTNTEKPKNKSAQKLVALRWKDKTPEELSAHGKMMVEARKAKRALKNKVGNK